MGFSTPQTYGYEINLPSLIKMCVRCGPSQTSAVSFPMRTTALFLKAVAPFPANLVVIHQVRIF
jgi:hypothetical protein